MNHNHNHNVNSLKYSRQGPLFFPVHGIPAVHSFLESFLRVSAASPAKRQCHRYGQEAVLQRDGRALVAWPRAAKGQVQVQQGTRGRHGRSEFGSVSQMRPGVLPRLSEEAAARGSCRGEPLPAVLLVELQRAELASHSARALRRSLRRRSERRRPGGHEGRRRFIRGLLPALLQL